MADHSIKGKTVIIAVLLLVMLFGLALVIGWRRTLDAWRPLAKVALIVTSVVAYCALAWALVGSKGVPFAGMAGQMLTRMLGGIGLDSAEALTLNLIPWRTAGDRPPTKREVEICLPFGMRLLELSRPKAILVLGNLPARVLSGSAKESIHSLRGKWFELDVAGRKVPALATFHPQDLVTAPVSKRLPRRCISGKK